MYSLPDSEGMETEVKEGKEESEVVPPWIYIPDSPPWESTWKQGNGEGWLDSVWRPFWTKLSDEEQIAYLKKWNPPPEWRTFFKVLRVSPH